MPTSRELLPRRALEMFGIELSSGELERIDRFIDVLARWRTRVNLVAARSTQELIDRHVLDALALTALTRSVHVAADLGSGAGFPGIVMGITAPDTRIHLLEARERRAAFLKEVARILALDNITVWPVRSERWQGGEQAELVAVRGVRAETAAAAARSLLAIGGALALMRKEGAGHFEAQGYEEVRKMGYRLPGGERHEVLVLRLRPD